ncbi:hypothetical protein H2198_007495 [Neophaeococcomyces mojaviensis]|uniref:Uncharacterized protein n=1 Tax=Neophaeococcomyces mojaviensis TaxID=3383035 RepID=A0ACC2ZZT1_9EURO|nr:hypothetical protein H2198_007495 [Knufia sp. JES_112]
MDHLIGQRFSLISKSEIRYVGTLHEINPGQSTIALENVFSFGTEDRQVANYVPPSQQKFEYIVFRGSDVKDIKIEEEPTEEAKPSQPPNDPAILNSSRPAPSQPAPQGPPSNRGESPFPPPNYPPPAQYGGFYPPPPPGQFGRGYGPPPGNFGPGPGFPPYGPPPGYFGPPGQGFPPGPNRFPHQPSAPIGPPGPRPPPPAQQPPAAGPISAPKQTPELPVEKTAPTDGSKGPITTPAPAPAPVPASAPTSDVTQPQPPKAADAPSTLSETVQPPPAAKAPPTQPKGNRVTPAMPFAVNQKSFTPPVSNPPTSVDSAPKPAASKAVQSQAEMEEASRQAKEAVAAAMAKINAQSMPKPAPQAFPAVDSVTDSFSQLAMASSSAPRGRGQYRGGRGARTSSGGHRQKMEIPQSDFDFESANAKFNKEDLIKEAIASGSPLGERPDTPLSGGIEEQINGMNGAPRKDSFPLNPAPAYNKSTSFFDNISSESKDREESSDGKVNARALRGQEFQKNVETFGQGNVDSGYRGRGRGGYRGRGRGDYNRSGNYRGGYRGRGRGAANFAETTQH